MDLIWLLIPAAVGLFALRVVMIGRRLKAASQVPSLADARTLSDAKEGLSAHREHLDVAIASPKAHLDTAKQLARVPPSSVARSRMDRMVEDYLPDRRL